jgi:hypothetical protein
MATDYAGHDATRLPQADDLRMMRATEQQHANGVLNVSLMEASQAYVGAYGPTMMTFGNHHYDGIDAVLQLFANRPASYTLEQIRAAMEHIGCTDGEIDRTIIRLTAPKPKTVEERVVEVLGKRFGAMIFLPRCVRFMVSCERKERPTMHELKHATDLQEQYAMHLQWKAEQLRFQCAETGLGHLGSVEGILRADAVKNIKRIDRLMGEVAALIANAVDAMGGFTDEPLPAEEFLAILKRKWQERDTWEEQAGKRLAAQKAEITELKRSRGSFSGMWKRAALENTTLEDENAALTAQVERLTAPVSEQEYADWFEGRKFHFTHKHFFNEIIAARAAAPATGAEKVHAPKTIVPEPDQRRIETERFPQKGEK